jgi:hypothetical protein
MNSPGYLYVFINPSMPGIIKIGRTTNLIEERAEQLSSVSGVPTPFIPVYYSYFSNSENAERIAHNKLTKFRISTGREFFRISTTLAIDTIISIHAQEDIQYEEKGQLYLPITSQNTEEALGPKTQKELGHSLYISAINALLGEEDHLQDWKEAIKLLHQSDQAGYADASYALGRIYLFGYGPTVDLDKALHYLNDGINKGSDRCWALLAYYYFKIQLTPMNVYKCCEHYLQSESFNKFPEIEKIETMILYIGICANYHMQIKYLDNINMLRAQLIKAIKDELKLTNSIGEDFTFYKKTFYVLRAIPKKLMVI